MSAKAPVALALLALLTACTDGSRQPTEPVQPPAASLSTLAQDVPARGEEGEDPWGPLSATELWAWIERSDSIALVGLKAPGAARGIYRSRILVGSPTRNQAQQAVISQPGVVFAGTDTIVPMVRVKLNGSGALELIRRLPFVDYHSDSKIT